MCRFSEVVVVEAVNRGGGGAKVLCHTVYSVMLDFSVSYSELLALICARK